MKTRNKFTILIILTASFALSFGACSRTDKLPETDLKAETGVEAWIAQVIPPQTITAGMPTTFELTYWKPNPCHTTTGIKAYHSNGEVELKVFLQGDPNPCAAVIDEESGSVDIIFPSAGQYMLRFKGTDGPDSLKVLVK